jgi:hypothetical protein
MRRLAVTIIGALALAFAAATPAFAGAPHFVGDPVLSVSGGTATVTAKEAGLGDEPQIVVNVSGTAQCVNPGNQDPQAANKVSFDQSFTEPVQNGHADYTVSVTPAFQPACSPPMSLTFDVTLTDVTNGLTVELGP